MPNLKRLMLGRDAHWAGRRDSPLQLTESERLTVVADCDRIGSKRGAAKQGHVRVHERTVRRWMNVYSATGTVHSPRRKNSGRPRTATSPGVVAKVVAAMTAAGDGEHVPGVEAVRRKLKLPYCRKSIGNAARAGGLQFKTKPQRTFLSAKNRDDRERWAKRLLKKGHDWRRTMCSDEKMFVLEDRQRRCWMTKANPRFRNTRQYPSKVLVWGGISLMGSTDIAFIDGTMDAHAYQEVLRKHLLPVASGFVWPWWFQQDGARPHTARSTMAWMAANGLPTPINWPPYSPDVSPIENLWGMLVEDVNATNPGSVTELCTAIRASWRKRVRDAELMESLLGHWRDRLHQVVAAKGGSIPY